MLADRDIDRNDGAGNPGGDHALAGGHDASDHRLGAGQRPLADLIDADEHRRPSALPGAAARAGPGASAGPAAFLLRVPVTGFGARLAASIARRLALLPAPLPILLRSLLPALGLRSGFGPGGPDFRRRGGDAKQRRCRREQRTRRT